MKVDKKYEQSDGRNNIIVQFQTLNYSKKFRTKLKHKFAS